MVEAPPSLPASALRWHCDPDTLGFATTAEVEPVEGIVGQPHRVHELLQVGPELVRRRHPLRRIEPHRRRVRAVPEVVFDRDVEGVPTPIAPG